MSCSKSMFAHRPPLARYKPEALNAIQPKSPPTIPNPDVLGLVVREASLYRVYVRVT